jgi:glycosyltransferase involved in cell wall biosynthesis
VGFVGTLKPWHGVAVLIEAFAQLHRRFPHARLLLVGDGPERANLEARVKQLGLEAVTHFTGAVAADEIPGLLAAMDVAVAPYPPLDNFYFSPLKAYEYMAAGCATVASRIGQLNDLIAHEQNGLLCEPGNANDLAAQLARLCSDTTMRRQLAAAGRQTILRGHTWDHVAGRILELAKTPATTHAGRAGSPLPAACVQNQNGAHGVTRPTTIAQFDTAV